MGIKKLWVLLCFCGVNANSENLVISPFQIPIQIQPSTIDFRDAAVNLGSEMQALMGAQNSNSAFLTMPSSVVLTAGNVSGTEDGTTSVVFTVIASDPVIGNQSVVLTISGTNVTTSDYTLDGMSQNSFMINIADGQTSGSVSLVIINDSEEEGPELLNATISNPTAGLILGSTTQQFVEILDDDLTFGMLNRSVLYNRSSIITIGGNKSLKNLGMLKGSGMLNANLVNTGILSPGNSN